MSFRIWLGVAALLGLTSVFAAAYGAHGLAAITTSATALKIFDTAQQFHSLHSVVLLGVAILMATTEGGRSGLASMALQVSAAAFALGMVLFCGGIYLGVITGVHTGASVVPVGGILLMAGWAALGVSAFGLAPKPS